MSELRRTLRRAADRGRGGLFMAAKAIEMELAYASLGDMLAVSMWGDPGDPVPREKVSVPRSLRRYFGRTVEAMAGRRGRRVKRPPRRNRRERPGCECRE